MVQVIANKDFNTPGLGWAITGKHEYVPGSGVRVWPGTVVKQLFVYSPTTNGHPTVGLWGDGSGTLDVYCNGILVNSFTPSTNSYTNINTKFGIPAGEVLIELRARETNPSYINIRYCYANPDIKYVMALCQATPATLIGSGVVAFAETLNATSWLWDFGDGVTSTEQNPQHEFFEVGEHISTLTTPTGSKRVLITVRPPTITSNFFTSHAETTPNTAITFTEWAEYATSWLWDFGDGGTSTEQNPTHTYAVKGKYTVSLTVSGEHGTAVKTKEITITATPVPNFSFFPVNGLTVQFSDLSLEDPTSWSWDFGENEHTLQNPVHSYQQAGTYNVTLTATNAIGSTPITKSVPVTVSEPVRPEADFSYQPTNGTPTQIEFADTSSNAPSSWLWNFGDGTTSTEQNPVHHYSSGGAYAVRLTVMNANGEASVSKTISVVMPGTTPPTSGTVTPDTAQANRTVTIAITGTGFKQGARIRVTHGSFRGIVSKIQSFSSTRIVFSFTFDPWFIGLNGIVITNKDGSSVVIPDCITVTE